MIRESRVLFDELPVERACALLEVSRSEFYRARESSGADTPGDPDRDLRAAVEALVLEWPWYGYRRITAQLQRDGWTINHKRVLRLMREGGWLCRRKRRWVRTTQSDHGLRVYPNLLKGCGWRRLTGLDQAWLADLTYIRLDDGFCYLAVILDAYSRRVVGWCLSRELDAGTTLAALEAALSQRRPDSGWIHHSDRGVQYACGDYVARIHAAGGSYQHVGHGQSARERTGGELHAHAQERGGLHPRVLNLPRRRALTWPVHHRGL